MAMVWQINESEGREKIFDKEKRYYTLWNSQIKGLNRSEYVGAGWMMHCYGMTFLEALKEIERSGAWNMTSAKRGLQSIYNETSRSKHIARGHVSHNNFNSACSPIFSQQHDTIEYLISEFKKYTSPVSKMLLSSMPQDAAWEYYELGYHVLPKAPKNCNCKKCMPKPIEKKGKHPDIKQIPHQTQFQTRQPSTKEMDKWDWSNGLCLLGNDEYSFLDIDLTGYEHVFQGWHVEKTPRKGLHVFGKGQCKTKNIAGIGEIKGLGSLIVAAPTPGYEVLT